tara:strand:+ start:370 stop:1053 length:684 start_codon:yes stop_codon:yes gene_type:complete
MNPSVVKELIHSYNENPQKYTDREAEVIAELSNAYGLDFKRESKAIRKGLFDLADVSTFGLLPDAWRPTSRGESVYGDTRGESFASGLGTLAGLIPSGYGLYQGARGLSKGARGLMSRFGKKGGAGGAGGATRGMRSSGDNLLELTSGSPLQLGEGQRLLTGQTGRQIRQNRFPLDSRSGRPIPMGPRIGSFPMSGDITYQLRGIRSAPATRGGNVLEEMRRLYGAG